MKNSDFIIEWVEKLRNDSKDFAYNDDDVRINFFWFINDIAYCYYRNYLLIEASILIYEKKIDFNSLSDNIHFKAIEALIKNEMSYQSHFNSLNRSFIVDAWSTFEHCISIICQSICTSEELDKLLNTEYNSIKKLLKKSQIIEEDDLKLKKEYTKRNLTHVSITRKIDLVFNKTNHYYGNIQDDKKFLLFFLKLRNSLHSNYIYYGNDFNYDFGNARFVFENGKTIVWHDPFKDTPKLYFFFTGRLVEIWSNLIKTIPSPGIIYYPDLTQP